MPETVGGQNGPVLPAHFPEAGTGQFGSRPSGQGGGVVKTEAVVVGVGVGVGAGVVAGVVVV